MCAGVPRFFEDEMERARGLREPAGRYDRAATVAGVAMRAILDARRARATDAVWPEGMDAHLVALREPTSFAAEQYRALRHLVEDLRKSAAVSILAVSSPSAGDGKTTTAINLAGALAQIREARILLVDADLRRPSLAERLGLAEPGPGLTRLVVSSRLALEDAVRTLAPCSLDVLPAGPPSSTPCDVLESPRLGELLGEARQRYDFVVLDTAPVLPVLDSRVLAKWVDGFIMVVAAHKTPRQLVAEALTLIDPSKVLGVVFNGDDRAAREYLATYGRSAGGSGAGWWRGRLRASGRAASGPTVPGTGLASPGSAEGRP